MQNNAKIKQAHELLQNLKAALLECYGKDELAKVVNWHNIEHLFEQMPHVGHAIITWLRPWEAKHHDAKEILRSNSNNKDLESNIGRHMSWRHFIDYTYGSKDKRRKTVFKVGEFVKFDDGHGEKVGRILNVVGEEYEVAEVKFPEDRYLHPLLLVPKVESLIYSLVNTWITRKTILYGFEVTCGYVNTYALLQYIKKNED